MKFYTRKAVNIISLVSTILIFFIIYKIDFQNFNFKFKEKQQIQNQLVQNELSQEEIPKKSEKENLTEKSKLEENIVNENYEWEISIPVIGLVAPIEETVEKEVMNRSVGHFPNTEKWEGNIGLGAHNRGYKVNYFQNIKNLKRGDKIIYKYNGQIRQYSVSNIVIIKDTDWSYLEKTEENKITLITCVENEPNYRRCIQGIEEEENKNENNI